MFRFLVGVLLFSSVLSCGTPPVSGAALRVTIDVKAMGLKSTCVLLELRDPATNTVIERTRGAARSGQTGIIAAIFRDTRPETITLQAIGFEDVGCTQPTSPVEVSEVKTESFPATGVRDVGLTLAVPMSVDGDGDGSPAGIDCDDADPARTPGKAELCTDGKDNDCNMFSDCGDSACTGMQCKLMGSTCAVTGRCAEVSCVDNLDNDADGTVDCTDSDCDGETCLNAGTCTGGACAGASNEVGLCQDGRDNDADGQTDCLDTDCAMQLCNDDDGCTLGETCQGTQCLGGMARVCGAGTNVCAASTAVCQRSDGGCLYTPLPADAGCSDGLACTLGDTCDGDGGCTGATLRECNTPPPGACLEAIGTCVEALDGGCVYGVAVRQSCGDMNLCTFNDECQADGGCSGTPVDCLMATPPNECLTPSGACAADAGCVFVARTGNCGVAGICMSGVCVEPPIDAGTGMDAGMRTDAGVDAGAAVDAGSSMDAGSVADAGFDAGSVADAGFDAGSVADAGFDAGSVADAGFDAGSVADAGFDAGSVADAGFDAGSTVDSGVFLPPSNFTVGQLPATSGSLHFNLGCNSTITLNAPGLNAPLITADDICLPPALPPFVRVSQGAGNPELIIFTVDRLTIRQNVTLRFTIGTGSAAAMVPVIAVKGNADIIGTIDVTAWPGPNRLGVPDNGVGASGSFCPMLSNGTTMSGRSGGGAGGSFGGVGGNGGRGAYSGGTGATAGAASTSQTLSPLRGGCAGSSGGNGTNSGRGGGAIQLWARGTVNITGRILAAGGPGTVTAIYSGGGGGGGSGGAILVEGSAVSFGPTALLAANGGSGAQGAGTTVASRPGAYGSFDVTTVNGGMPGSQCGGLGGVGAARNGGSTGGGAGATSSSCTITAGGGGGGGGSVGRLRVNSLNPCVVATGARFSPASTSAQPSCAR
jgi:hypothetical protein